MSPDEKALDEFWGNCDESVLIEITSASGSTPREQGTWMLVCSSDTFNTIGGGQLEYMAIDQARSMLSRRTLRKSEMEVPLGPEIGQCCGGHVSLKLSVLDEKSRSTIMSWLNKEYKSRPHVYVFGAGHVGNALVEALLLLPVHTELVDGREAELAKATDAVVKRHLALPETIIRDAPVGSAFVILTHDHALDFLLTKEALARGDAAYVGMIGSDTKRAKFFNWLKRETDAHFNSEALACPIGGLPISDKRPEVIAALAAAEIITHFASQPGKSTSDVELEKSRVGS